jgi:L-threonylcarbamoyladenylate synthase
MATANEIKEAAAILRSGGLVAFPTETVYGLGADADNEAAVRKIFAAKGRPADHPVIVHLAGMMEIVEWSGQIPKEAWRLAETYWPGPLTLILPRLPRAKNVVTGGLDTVGLRVPSHPVAQSLLREFGGAIAAPSANRFGHVSPTQAEHVRQDFAGRVDLILDGGDCEVGLESTIVDLSGDEPVILRPGAITQQQVEAVCGRHMPSPETSSTRCSGRLSSHYAPHAELDLVEPAGLLEKIKSLVQQGKKVAVLGAGDVRLPPGIEQIAWEGTSAERAHNLYAALREVDERQCQWALVVLPALETERFGLESAILDRLQKAAAPRLPETLQ